MGLLDTLVGANLVLISPTGIAFGTFFMRAFFSDLPEELEQAARIDGCSELQIFAQVMLPLVGSGIGALAVFTFLSNWNNFLVPLLYLPGGEYRPLTAGLYNFTGGRSMDIGPLAAGLPDHHPAGDRVVPGPAEAGHRRASSPAPSRADHPLPSGRRATTWSVSVSLPGIEVVPDAELPAGRGRGPDRTLYSGISAGTELTAYRGSNPYLNKRWDPAPGCSSTATRPSATPSTAGGTRRSERSSSSAPTCRGSRSVTESGAPGAPDRHRARTGPSRPAGARSQRRPSDRHLFPDCGDRAERRTGRRHPRR